MNLDVEKKAERDGVLMSEELITEQAGFRSTKEIVEGMQLSGQMLERYRFGRLDNLDEGDEELQEESAPYQEDLVDAENRIRRTIRLRSELKCSKDLKAGEQKEKIGEISKEVSEELPKSTGTDVQDSQIS